MTTDVFLSQEEEAEEKAQKEDIIENTGWKHQRRGGSANNFWLSLSQE